MKKSLILLSTLVLSLACSSNPPVSTNSQPSGTDANRQDLEAVTAHSADRAPKMNPGSQGADGPAAPGGWSRGGDPIDTTEFDKEIADAKKKSDAAPNDDAAKKALASAYFKRGEALTRARQYAAALGDYRKAVKLDPANEEAKQWIKQIVVIYNGLNKEYPKEGEEPDPLPFDASSSKSAEME